MNRCVHSSYHCNRSVKIRIAEAILFIFCQNGGNRWTVFLLGGSVMIAKFKSKLMGAALVAGLALSAGVASAATVTYTSVSTNPQMQLTIDDSVAGKFRFSLSTLVGAADFLGLGFNLAGTSNPLTSALFTLVSATNAANQSITPALQLFGTDTGLQSACGQGCNFNGAGSASMFDYILRIGSNGGNANNFVKTVVFDLTYTGNLGNNPFSQLAIRAQSTTGPSTSIKTDLTITRVPPPPPPPPTPVPLPASGLLLAAGLGFLALKRRRS